MITQSPKPHILIVEDNPDNSLLVAKILTYFGLEITVVANGEDAISFCEGHTPDLILMDLSLPDKDGIEVTRILRQKEAMQSIPIVALTAHAMKGIRDKALKAGLTDFLAKPFLPNDLIAIVRQHLSSH